MRGSEHSDKQRRGCDTDECGERGTGTGSRAQEPGPRVPCMASPQAGL